MIYFIAANTAIAAVFLLKLSPNKDETALPMLNATTNCIAGHADRFNESYDLLISEQLNRYYSSDYDLFGKESMVIFCCDYCLNG